MRCALNARKTNKIKQIFIKISLISILLVPSSSFALCKASLGSNMMKAIAALCYECMFPIRIASIPVAVGPMWNEPALTGSFQPLCICPMPPPIFFRIGIPVSFFEPSRIVEIVSDAYCFPTLGIDMASNFTGGVLGGTEATGDHGQSNTFFQAHWYTFPLYTWLEIMIDVLCVEMTSFDIAYITEIDPMWQNDSLSAWMSPEAVLFGNPIAQLACAADSVAATISRYSLDPLFWCKGTWGNAYPLAGNTIGKNFVEDSASVAATFIYKLHREMLLWNQFGPGILLCFKWPSPIWFKNAYRLQLISPVPHFLAVVIGQSGIEWTPAKNIPFIGDNFSYIVFKKKECCVL